MRSFLISLPLLLSFFIFPIHLNGQATTFENYVMTNVVKTAGVFNEAAVQALPITTQGKLQTIGYVDGLGRPLQSVITKASASQKDIVSPVEYDQFGREVKKYLPYADVNGSINYGGFKNDWSTNQPTFNNGQLQGVDADAAPYSQTVFESSPLNRVLAQGAPGTVWQPNMSDAYDASKKVIKVKYEINTDADAIKLFSIASDGSITTNANYPTGQLSVKTTIDEHGGVVKEFTDKLGHVILKRVFLETDSLQTYYIYDDFEQLAAVIQPEGVTALTSATWASDASFVDKWVFTYKYDERHRMIEKKVPGAAKVLMVYDQWDRLVLTQDGNLRTTNDWLFTKYDELNRPIITGKITDTRSEPDIRAAVMASSSRNETITVSASEGYTLNGSFPSSSNYTLTIYMITHYDNYNNLPSWSSGYSFVAENGLNSYNTFLTGQVIATQTRILNTDNWIRTVSYYDDKYRPVQITSDNNVSGKDRITRILTFDGKVSSEYQTHTSSFYTAPVVVKKTYTYDHADRVLKITHQIANGEQVTIAENTYNEMGQLLNKKLHQSVSHPNYLQKLDYSYNIRGWLNSINKPYNDAQNYDETDLFNFELHYNTVNMDATPQFNGNIAEQVWKGGYDEYLRGYKYSYDKANRFLHASYGFKYLDNWGTPEWDWTQRYDEEVAAYDHNGNIKQLTRWHGTWLKVDDLQYVKWDGNKLLTVQDWAPANLPVGFKDGVDAPYDDYQYDPNGNMNFDHNKGIQSISYNHLNLPQLITMENNKGTIEYTYDAAGSKLQKKVTDNLGNKITITKYAGAFVYTSSYPINGTPTPDVPELVSHEEGKVRPKPIDATQPLSLANIQYEYDYFLKDHLGNVRMVITAEQQTDLYAGTIETANAAKEEQLFKNVAETRITKPGGFDSDTSNHSVARVNGNINTTGNKRVGPAIVLKVMAGDTISISTNAWYQGSAQAPPSGLTPIADELLSQLTNGVVAANGGKGGVFSSSDISSWLSPVVGDYLQNTENPNYDSTKPKAFLNWMIVDEEFKKVTSPNHMGVVQVPSISGATEKQPLIGPANLVVRRNGWLYVYVSNESNQDVYFDDIVVNHKRGPVVEATDYYPFGTAIAGISTRAAGKLETRNKFNNGSELSNKEFSDGTGLELYETEFRPYDPQIARFIQIDKFAEVTHMLSGYSFASDNPIKYNDPFGLLSDSLHPQELAQVVVRAAAPGSMTYQLNRLSREGLGAWVDDMRRRYSISQIRHWTLGNNLLTDKARDIIDYSLTSSSIKYRARMNAAWRTEGKIYKFLLSSALIAFGGEIVGIVGEGSESAEIAETTTDVGLESAEITISTAEDLLSDIELTGETYKNGEIAGEIEGNAAEIEANVAKNSTEVAKGQYKLSDGTHVKFYESTKGGGSSMQINTGNQIYKVRIK